VIRINGDPDLAAQAAANNWPGSGSESDPYVISGLGIDAGGGGYGVYVGNVTSFLILSDLTVSGANGASDAYAKRAGAIIVLGSRNVVVDSCQVTDSAYGIALIDSRSVTVTNCAVSGCKNGIALVSCYGCAIIGSSVSNCSTYGIRADEIWPLSSVIWSNGNSIYGNSITSNNVAACSFALNKWNTDVYGNYWGDAADSDYDGIADSPVVIWSLGDIDSKPLAVREVPVALDSQGTVWTNSTALSVSGTTLPGYKVDVSGSVVTASGDGSFSATVYLAEGMNSIPVSSVSPIPEAIAARSATLFAFYDADMGEILRLLEENEELNGALASVLAQAGAVESRRDIAEAQAGAMVAQLEAARERLSELERSLEDAEGRVDEETANSSLLIAGLRDARARQVEAEAGLAALEAERSALMAALGLDDAGMSELAELLELIERLDAADEEARLLTSQLSAAALQRSAAVQVGLSLESSMASAIKDAEAASAELLRLRDELSASQERLDLARAENERLRTDLVDAEAEAVVIGDPMAPPTLDEAAQENERLLREVGEAEARLADAAGSLAEANATRDAAALDLYYVNADVSETASHLASANSSLAALESANRALADALEDAEAAAYGSQELSATLHADVGSLSATLDRLGGGLGLEGMLEKSAALLEEAEARNAALRDELDLRKAELASLESRNHELADELFTLRVRTEADKEGIRAISGEIAADNEAAQELEEENQELSGALSRPEKGPGDGDGGPLAITLVGIAIMVLLTLHVLTGRSGRRGR